jgi:hypothetical protein
LNNLANNQNQTSPIQSLSTHSTEHQSQATTGLPPRSTFGDDEQQLLNAIHAHPNKRDLVLNLLRQMNQSSPSTTSSIHQEQQQQQTNLNYHHQQQQRHSEPSANYDPHRTHSNMEHDDESFF